ncbi:MAG: energy transducer TonB [Muribaculaceae bacterium]|nr:energy transducer TonB [Muribaculaceae bacterium]
MPTGIIMRKRSIWRRLSELTLGIGICAGFFLTTINSEAGVSRPTIEIPDSLKDPALILADSTQITKDNKVSEVPEIPATFPGGIKALYKYLEKEVKYPRKAEENYVEGRVLVKFVINEEGCVTNPSVIQSVSPELDAEALRVVKSFPKWNSAWDDGKRVPYYYVLPIQFRIPRPIIEILDSLVEPKLVFANMTEITKDNNVSKVPEIPATFSGGMKGLNKYIGKEARYPRKAAKNKVDGLVLVKFVINEKGYVTKPSVIQGVSPELDAEALRLVKSLPRWNAAWDDGKRVPYDYVLPIQFRLPEGYVPEKNYWFNQIGEFLLFLLPFFRGA